MSKVTLDALRRYAVANAFFTTETPLDAINRMGFVQSDPIRSPARAQDLILRQRVNGYRAGDLERIYPGLPIEEDYLYAYGFVPERVWRWLHPRASLRLTARMQRVFDLVVTAGRTHPRDLEIHFGARREVNAWGGYSKATTRTLDALHYYGHLRIAGREKGIRLYEPLRPENHQALHVTERLQQLILLALRLLAPAPERSFRSALRLVKGYAAPALSSKPKLLAQMIHAGLIQTAEVGDVRYLFPAGEWRAPESEERVRFLAPFDPLVWDRYRFELFWNWAYRFEAYTPPAKRKMGYYAMPMLWMDRVVGWVNVRKEAKRVVIEPGFINRKPSAAAFRRALDEEAHAMMRFLVGD